jgi:hypothetical protein
MQALVGLIALVAVFMLSQLVAARRIQKACRIIVADLERLGAHDPISAVSLPYAGTRLLHLGLRDFRPKALQGLVSAGIVGTTGRGAYFIKNREQAARLRAHTA